LILQNFVIKLGIEDELLEKYSLSHKLSLPDALIAATAIVYGIELFTLNLKDFKFIKQVKLLDVF
jgi:hypothetical protein